MPRMGGLAIFLAFFVTLLLVVRVSGPFTGLLAGCALVFLTGWLDDLFGLSPLMKLLGHESMATSQRYVSAAGSETRSAAAHGDEATLGVRKKSHSPNYVLTKV